MVSHETRSSSSMRIGAAEHGSQQHNKLYRSSLLLEVAANTASGVDFVAHPLIRQNSNKSTNQKAAFILHEEPPTNVATLPKLRQLHGRSAARAKFAYVPASSAQTQQQQVPDAGDLILFTRVSLCLVSSRYQPPLGSRGQGAAIIKSASEEGEGRGWGEGRSAGMR